MVSDAMDAGIVPEGDNVILERKKAGSLLSVLSELKAAFVLCDLRIPGFMAGREPKLCKAALAVQKMQADRAAAAAAAAEARVRAMVAARRPPAPPATTSEHPRRTGHFRGA